MTNEEATRIAIGLRTDFKCESDTMVDFCNTVIKALEQQPKAGYISIDDVMSVFDDFMCGEVDENGTETFLEMLKDKAEREEEYGRCGITY